MRLVNVRRIARACFLALISFFSCSEPSSGLIEILPTPSAIKASHGSFAIKASTTIHAPDSLSQAGILLQEYLFELTGHQLLFSTQPGPNQISLQLADLEKEAYQIDADSKGIALRGGSQQGLMHAIQSLRQLIMLNRGAIPALTLSDEPRFPWRGMLLDCSRHFMEKDFVKRYIDLLAFYKMNVLHWHLTEDQGWRIQINKYPLLTEVGAWRDDGNGGRYGGFYSKSDIREIIDYAESRGVMVVPEIELPGHSQAALAAYPQFSCTGGPFEVETEWGVFKEIYCAGNDSTFTFLEDVLSEVVELFPSSYIHIGGDEVPKYRWEHCKKCQRRIQEEGLKDEHELQTYFINRIGKFLQSKGKTMIGWDEILEGGLPEAAIVQSWRGFEGAKVAVEAGGYAIVSPTSHAYFDYGLNDIDLERVHGFNPVPEGVTQEEAARILGGECNMWSERASQQKVDQKVFPRIIAMSEVLWNGQQKPDFEVFRTTLSKHYPMLDELGVNYGFETVPVAIQTQTQNGKLYASLTSYDSTLGIYYSQNEARSRYSEPVLIEKENRWAVTFEKGDAQFKDTIFQHFLPHLANGITAEVEQDYHPNYSAGGVIALTDGKKGSTHFRDGNWQGYWGGDVDVTIDLGEEVEIKSLSSGFLQYNNAWIFLPTQVSYSISLDGKNYTAVGRVENPISPKEKEQLYRDFRYSFADPAPARFVRMHAENLGVCPDWHDAAGSDAWLFIDEFSVK